MAGYVIKVTIENTHPPVWRRIVVPEKINFKSLHRILQAVFQWEDEHLHEFMLPDGRIRIVMKDEHGAGGVSEEKVRIDEFLRECRFIRYIYDFGDDWRHKIVFEKEDPDYQSRCAMVVKHKGDSFEEDSGGVWGNEDGTFRIPFHMDEVNQKLQKMHFPVQRETKDGGELLDEIKFQDAMRRFSKMNFKELKKEVQKHSERMGFIEETQLSELAGKVRRWVFLYDKNRMSWSGKFLKNVSKKSSVELLNELNLKGAQEYCKYIGADIEGTDGVGQCVEKFWEELEKHPEYLAYVFDWTELKELMKLVEAPNGALNELPDQAAVERAIALGLFDISEEKVNRNQYIVLYPAAEATGLLNQYSQAEWIRICKRCQQRIEKTNSLLHLYSMMELDVFCEKYQEYFEPSVKKEEVLRCVYLAGTLSRSLQTAESENGSAYIAEYPINMDKVFIEQRDTGVEIEYRSFSPQERKTALQGYGELYPIWSEYYEYVTYVYGLNDEETEEYLHEDYYAVRNGERAEVLWEKVRRLHMLQSVECYVSFWDYFFGVCLTTGIPALKGYSREEYARLTGVSPLELGIYGNWKPVKKIMAKTHLYEMPQDMQSRIFEAVHYASDDERIGELKEILQEIGCKNYELEFLLGTELIQKEKYEEAEGYFKDIQKAYPKDESVKLILSTMEEMTKFKEKICFEEEEEEAEWSVWDMMDGKLPKSNVETFRRELPKIGRNDPCPCGSGKKYKKCCGR